MTTGVHFFDHWVQNDLWGVHFSDHGVQMLFWEGSKVNTPSADYASDSQTGQKANKRFQQQPMCRNPLFSAVFPIFCSFPLYQLSGLHFQELLYRSPCKVLMPGNILPQKRPLVGDAVALFLTILYGKEIYCIHITYSCRNNT